LYVGELAPYALEAQQRRIADQFDAAAAEFRASGRTLAVSKF
jgi:hypothetical protein